MITTVLFDLDGTLLPMDQDVFVKNYFGLLARKLAPHGYDPKKLIDGIWAGTEVMIRNNGSKTNEEAFWDKFAQLMGENARLDEPVFAEYYANEFQAVKEVCGYTPAAAETVEMLKKKGVRVALATNPIFPAIATESRIRWAGMEPGDFALYTTYENSCHSKPNPAYYQDICEKLGVEPENCLMVGNDVGDDMVAQQLGMQVFLLTDCLINKNNEDISKYPNGGFAELGAFLEQHL